ncbi:MAG: hypothetical protein ACFFGP_02540, partial [Promethearchaeota archaeon]
MNETKLDLESLDRIQKIRKYIQELDNVANEILKLLSLKNYSNQSSMRILISNVKEYYYHTTKAWEKLNVALITKNLRFEDSKSHLYLAKSRLTQSISELKVLDNKKIQKMISKVEEVFQNCWNAFFDEFEILEPEKKIKEPLQEILELSKTMYQLP